MQYYDIFVTIINQNGRLSLTKICISFSDFLSFYLSLFSVLGSHLGSHILFSCHGPIGSSWQWQFLRLSLFLISLTVLRNEYLDICTLFLYWDLSDVLVMIRLCVLGNNTTEVKCHFITSQKENTLTVWPLTIDINPYYLAEVVFEKSKKVTLPAPLPFHTVCLEGRLCTVHS